MIKAQPVHRSLSGARVRRVRQMGSPQRMQQGLPGASSRARELSR